MNKQFATGATLSLLLLVAAAVPALAASEGSFQRTLKVTGPVNLDITTGSGNISVSTSVPSSLPDCASGKHFSQPSNAQVQVIACIRANDWFGDGASKVRRLEENPPIEQSGDNIRIGHIDDPSLRENIAISYIVVAPPHTALRSHTGSGNQDIQGLRETADVSTGSGSLKISDVGDSVRSDTGSGNIELSNIRGDTYAKSGSGSIRARDIAGGFDGETGSGNISLEQTAPGAVHAETGSGSLQMNGLRGSVRATSGSGNIRVQGDPTGAWTLHTGSGSVQFQVASNASFNLHAHTGSGGITVAQPLTIQGQIKRNDANGTVRGGGVPVNIETGSGSISIE